MKGKQTMVFALAAAMALGSTMSAFAGQWMKDDVGYWWQEDDGSYPVDTMKWIDADGDTVSEGYYFDENGYVYDCMSRGPNMTLEEYMNAQMPRTSAETTHHGEGYDPAHPLAGKVDEWNLRLVETDWDNRIMGTVDTIASCNVHAMLTGQMDQYFAAPVGEWINPETGTRVYTEQEDYDNARKNEQAVYEWFCNWLNTMDFENMTEMEKALEIQKVLRQAHWEMVNDGMDCYYHILVDHHGVCTEFAMTACSLARALGLKSGVNGTGNHTVYYIQVDGKGYFGSNEILNLDVPTPAYVYFH